jgi:hypothetical protein
MLKRAFNLKDFVNKITGSYSLEKICTDKFIEDLICIYDRFTLHAKMLERKKDLYISSDPAVNTGIFEIKLSALRYTEQELKFLCGKLRNLEDQCNKNRSSKNIRSYLPSRIKTITEKCSPYDINTEMNLGIRSSWNEVYICKDIIKKTNSKFFDILKSHDPSFDPIFKNLKNSCFKIIAANKGKGR